MKQGKTLFETIAGRHRWDERALVPVAYNMAVKSPEEASRFIETYGGALPDFGQTARAKVPALGWVAVAIAGREPEKARASIDRGLDLCVHAVPPWEESDWDGLGGRPAQAAVLARRRTGSGIRTWRAYACASSRRGCRPATAAQEPCGRT